MQVNTHELIRIAKIAGKIIMGYYDGEVDISIKDDKSPVTAADIAANDYIVSELKKLTPDVPIVSEEIVNQYDRKELGLFWIVDPLDGTKSFIKKSGEFTVNIALIKNKTPIFGVIYIPAKDVVYYTDNNGCAFVQEQRKASSPIKCRSVAEDGAIVVASLSHRTKETDDYIDTVKTKEIISAGSSLKFCLVAEGKADLYPRFGTTMEWDIAAGHAILKAAGGKVSNIDGSDFTYNKSDFRNGYFVARGL